MVVGLNENPLVDGNIFNAQVGTYYVKNENRVTKNLQVLYNFSEGNGDQIKDLSGIGAPLDLNISNPSSVTWLPGQGLKVSGNTMISAEDPPADLMKSISNTGEITLEAWIKPMESAQSGPASIITLSTDNDHRATTLGQTGNDTGYDYNVRLNTTSTSENGLPEISSSDKYQVLALQHVIYTRDKQGNEKIYIDGVQRYSGIRKGDFSTWSNTFQLALANELTGDKPWKGTYFLVAIYSRALNSNEVLQNFNAGYGKLEFNSVLKNLEPETLYFLMGFAETNQGVQYGDVVKFVTRNNFRADEDSIQMNVYPNPSDGNFRVSFHYDKIDQARIQISDLTGKIIHSTTMPVNAYGLIQEKEFNLSPKLKNGIYFVTLLLGETINTRKLIIHH